MGGGRGGLQVDEFAFFVFHGGIAEVGWWNVDSWVSSLVRGDPDAQDEFYYRQIHYWWPRLVIMVRVGVT